MADQMHARKLTSGQGNIGKQQKSIENVLVWCKIILNILVVCPHLIFHSLKKADEPGVTARHQRWELPPNMEGEGGEVSRRLKKTFRSYIHFPNPSRP
jgi:hypothetical protein